VIPTTSYPYRVLTRKTKTWGGQRWEQISWPNVFQALTKLKIKDDEETHNQAVLTPPHSWLNGLAQ